MLTWDPDKYNDITTVRLDASLVWIPDIVLYNRLVLTQKASATGIGFWLGKVPLLNLSLHAAFSRRLAIQQLKSNSEMWTGILNIRK